MYTRTFGTIRELHADTIRARALGIGDRLQAIFEEARATGLTTYAVAVKQASGIVVEAKRSGHAARRTRARSALGVLAYAYMLIGNPQQNTDGIHDAVHVTG